MPHWWGKSSSKEVKKKKVKRESIFDTIQQKFKNASEKKCSDKSGGSRRHRVEIVSPKGSRSVVTSRSPSSSTHVSRCQSFTDMLLSQQPPLPASHPPTVTDADSEIILIPKLERVRVSRPSQYLPLSKPGNVSNRGYPTDAEGEIATACASCDSSVGSGDSSDSHIVISLATHYESGNRGAINGCFRLVHKDQSPTTVKKNSRASSKLSPQLGTTKNLSASPKRNRLHLQNLKIARSCGLCSAPASSRSSPSSSPTRALGPEPVLNSVLWTGKPYPDVASGHCSSPGSGISGGGDLPGKVFLQQNRCSPEYTPMLSPRILSSGPSSRMQSGAVTPLAGAAAAAEIPALISSGLSSRIQSGAVTPLAGAAAAAEMPALISSGLSSRIQSGAVTPRAGVAAAAEMPARRLDDVKHETHPLPLPPITTTSYCESSPNYSAPTTPYASRSPARAENPTTQGSSWKKGKLIGRGTFGHVYLGFNRQSGEMCAMKEVTLFSDDAKSRECAQQLGQEIAVLSQLRHPNIVGYYGSETVDDKLYIYLEYVSGGSIYKLLQEYGELGESAIRNYTRQILSGLAYLHAKNTVHRDIKGANILVDPNGGIKLADFGMAKHITGQSCPFSFKGSPYWMAPEVIKNSSGCNLAVDIWSLGCTVLEMAMTKPPWSQFEGVAAMFKILYGMDLPEFPENLSEDGKDFIRLCLQRDPEMRPSAAQLLEHPFVRKATPERPIMTAFPSEPPQSVVNALRSMAIGPVKYNLEPEGALRTGSGSSDAHAASNKSGPLSTVRNLHLPTRTLDVTGGVATSPLAGPHQTAPVIGSGGRGRDGAPSPLASPHHPSTLVIRGGASSSNKQKQPMYSNDAVGMNQRPHDIFHYQEPRHDPHPHDIFHYQEPRHDLHDPHPLRGTSHARREIHQLTSPGNNAHANHYRRVTPGAQRESHPVPQMLLRDYMRVNTTSSLDRRAGTPRPGNRNGL